MQSYKPVGALRGGGHLGDREARRVGRKDRRRTAQAVQLLEEGVLEAQILGNRLDDDVHALQVGDGRREGQALERCVARGGIELALLHELGERLFDPRATSVEQLFRDVADDRVVAGGRRHLRDAAPHQPASQHSNALDLAHGAPKALRTWSAMRSRGCCAGSACSARISPRSSRSSTCSIATCTRSFSTRWRRATSPAVGISTSAGTSAMRPNVTANAAVDRAPSVKTTAPPCSRRLRLGRMSATNPTWQKPGSSCVVCPVTSSALARANRRPFAPRARWIVANAPAFGSQLV